MALVTTEGSLPHWPTEPHGLPGLIGGGQNIKIRRRLWCRCVADLEVFPVEGAPEDAPRCIGERLTLAGTNLEIQKSSAEIGGSNEHRFNLPDSSDSSAPFMTNLALALAESYLPAHR